MANTEGLTDEEMLRSVNATVKDWSRPSSLAERLDPSSELRGSTRPAAKVIRKSNPSSARILLPSNASEYGAIAGAKEREKPRSSAAPPVVLGNIVERPRQKRRHKPQRQQHQRQQQQQQRCDTSSIQSGTPVHQSPPVQGFPSLNKPFGTLAPRPRRGLLPVPSTTSPSVSSPSSPRPPQHSNTNNHTNIPKDDMQSLQKASAMDADRMLASMTPQEIHQGQQELHTFLSADAVTFLQQRGRQKRLQQQLTTTTTKPTTTLPQTHSATVPSNQSLPGFQPQSPSSSDPERHERQEKERLAALLAAVQTHDDMDALYQAEMGEPLPLGSAKAVSSGGNKSDWGSLAADASVTAATTTTLDNATDETSFSVACDLLRSTAPRQVLWAAQLVRKRLAHDYSQYRRRRLHRRNGGHEPVPWSYPTLLPVSLRCVLDQPPHRVNGWSLQTNALQALYLLLRLRCPPEYDVDLWTHHDTPANTTPTENLGEEEDATAIYQLVLGQDAVPTHPPATLYTATTVQPLSTRHGPTSAAYATSSSSTTALADGQKFAQDPAWTLLSQMRILPRLAAFWRPPKEGSSGNDASIFFPTEARLATLGILAMVAQRSPGAASAMVQHPTLLADVARVVWDDDDGEGEESSEIVTTAVVRLYTVLARQSRTAATGLDAPPWGRLLGKPSHPSTNVQRWALVLWRTLLRYGLALSELENMLTLGAPHLAILSPQCSLAVDYLSCFGLVLAVHHNRVVEAKTDERHRLEMRQLVHAHTCLMSCNRAVLNHLTQERVWHPDENSALLVLAAGCLAFYRQYAMAGELIESDLSGEYKRDGSEMEDSCTYLEALRLMASNGALLSAVELVSPHFFAGTITTNSTSEAVAARFLSEYSAAIGMLLRKTSNHAGVGPLLQQFETLASVVSAVLIKTLSERSIQEPSYDLTLSLICSGWRSRGRLALLELVRMTCPREAFAPSIRTAMGVTTLSCFQVGEEALMDRVLQLEMINLPLNLRSMLRAQLYSTAQKKLQMKHSRVICSDFLLVHGDSFEVQSLRSESDPLGPLSDENEASILPMGPYFLWKILAGSSSSTTPIEQVIQVLASTLSVLHEVELVDTEDVAKTMSDGSKMYFLLNVCLQSEQVLADETVSTLCVQLLHKLTRHVDADFVRAFADACVGHSSTPATDSSAKGASEEEDKLAMALLEGESSPTSELSGKPLHIVMAFVNELCTSFCDYGAQYPFFGMCFRVFLFPAFPSKIRCEVLRRLQGLLHLLFLPEEEEDDDSSLALMIKNLTAPQLDGDTLDTLALCFAKSSPNTLRRGLMTNYAIAALGLALGGAVQRGKLDSQLQRLECLHPSVLAGVAQVATHYVEGTEDALYVPYEDPAARTMTLNDLVDQFRQ